MQIEPHGLIVDKLRVRGSTEPTLARLRLEVALGLMDLTPQGLTHDAIFVVRKLRVRGQTALWEQSLDVALVRSWERQIHGRLDQLLRSAARPAHGPVPAEAEAVVFADAAEWLACLLRAALQARLAECWWFASLLKRFAPSQLAVHALAQHPRCVPIALEQLARSGSVQRVAELVSEASVMALYRQLVECHGVPGLSDVVSARPDNRCPRRDSTEPLFVHPFAAHVQELGSGSLWTRLWVGTALTLAREPRRARTQRFEAAVRDWLIEQQTPGRAVAAEETRAGGVAHAHLPPALTVASEPDPPPPLAAEQHTQPAQRREPMQSKHRVEVPNPVAPDPRMSMAAQLTADPPAEPIERIAARTVVPARREASAQQAQPEPNSEPLPQHAFYTPAQSRSVPPLAADLHDAESIGIETELGGAFFLVLIGMRLGLYSDVFSPRERSIDLPLWDFVALLARELLGDAWAPTDPLWALLERISGRAKGEPLGAEFQPPDTCPAAWLSACSELVDDFCESALARWMMWLARFVRARLALALDVEAPRVVHMLLRHRARVTVTALRVDVTMSLAQHPIELRRAGLDRDVGYIPAASRSLYFHFAAAAHEKET